MMKERNAGTLMPETMRYARTAKSAPMAASFLTGKRSASGETSENVQSSSAKTKPPTMLM